MRRWLIAAAVAVGLATAPGPGVAQGLLTEMDQMFGTLSNATPWGADYRTQSRGEISGGGLYVRSRVVNADLFNIQPPGFRAGCGGLDFFAGSFSFINKEQFIQLMRSVAANAAGYAFNIAMNELCPTCMEMIETLTNKINELNRYMGNSCQLAQGLVNDTLAAATGKKYGEASLVSVFEGIGDTFESFTTSGGQTPTTALRETAPQEFVGKVTGNLVWRALRQHGVASWLGGDNALLEVMMNVTGTVIIRDATPGGEEAELDVRIIQPNPKIMEAMINGEPLTILGCENPGQNLCLFPVTRDIALQGRGFRQRVFEALTDPTNGVIAQIRAQGGGQPVAATQLIVGSLPGSAGALLVRLATISDQAALTFADMASTQIAIEMTRQIVQAMHDGVRKATAGLDDGYATQVEELIQRSQSEITAELARLTAVHGNVFELVEAYNRYLQVMPAGSYALPAARLQTASN